jgi:hypothetical protein
MDILRPPPGQEGDEAPPPSRNRFARFVFAILFLVIGMVIFFVGGLVVRNPELPNYLLDQIVRRFQGAPPSGVRMNAPDHTATTKTSQTPPPAPTTAEGYVDLMNYDESMLSPNERTVASVLTQMVPYVLVGSAPTERFTQEIFPALQALKPGDDVTKIRTIVQECRDLVSKYIRHCQDGAVQVEAKLSGTGLTAAMAHDVAQAFARRPLTNGTLYWPDEFNKACDDADTLIDLLAKNPSKWKRVADGQLSFTSPALIDQFNATSKDLNTALRRATYGSAADKLPSFLPRTVNECLNLMNYDEKTLPPGERAVASVLNQTTTDVSGTGMARWSSRLAQLFNEKIAPGLRNLQPGGDVSQIENAVSECREKASATIKFYQGFTEHLASQLIAAGIPDSLAQQTAETFAQQAHASQNISWASNVNLACKSVSTLVDLFSKNPSKWKRNAQGQVQFANQALVEQFKSADRALNSAIKAINGG